MSSSSWWRRYHNFVCTYNDRLPQQPTPILNIYLIKTQSEKYYYLLILFMLEKHNIYNIKYNTANIITVHIESYIPTSHGQFQNLPQITSR